MTLTFAVGAAVIAALVVAAMIITLSLNRALGRGEFVSHSVVAILLAITLNNAIRREHVYDRAASLAATTFLHVGIVLQGIRLGIADVLSLGGDLLPYVLLAIVTGLITGAVMSRLVRLSGSLGALITVGTAICGNSAIMAVAPLVRAKAEETAYAIGTITLFGFAAALTYPYLLHFIFDGEVLAVGTLLGVGIHDTSQVVAAGLIHDQTFGGTSVAEVAILTKLLRNLFMVVLIPIVAVLATRNHSHVSRKGLGDFTQVVPLFVIGFMLMVAFRTIGDALLESNGSAWLVLTPANWNRLVDFTTDASVYLLVTALAGIGLKTRLASIATLGLRPLVTGLTVALAIGLTSGFAIGLVGI